MELFLRFLYADPTPNALQVFLTKEDVLDDKGIAPVPANSTAGLAPSAASAQLDTVVHSNNGFKSTSEPEVEDLNSAAASGDSDGKEIKSAEQGVWINADPIPGCIVCNIGESEFMFGFKLDLPPFTMHAKCGRYGPTGLYKSTLHRVMHRGSNYR